MEQCLTEHQSDPLFQVFVILTEKKDLLKNYLKRSFHESDGDQNYIRFIFAKNRCLDFNDPKLYEKLFRKLARNKQSKIQKNSQRSDEEIFLNDGTAEENDYNFHEDCQSSPDPNSSSVPSNTDKSIDQKKPRNVLEYADIDVRFLCDHQRVSSNERQNQMPKSEMCDKDLKIHNSNECYTSENDKTNHCGNR